MMTVAVEAARRVTVGCDIAAGDGMRPHREGTAAFSATHRPCLWIQPPPPFQPVKGPSCWRP